MPLSILTLSLPLADGQGAVEAAIEHKADEWHVLTNKELIAELAKRGCSTGILLGSLFPLLQFSHPEGGAKAKLVQRLIDSERRLLDPENTQRIRDEFYHPTLSADHDNPPTVNAWYRTTYKNVDKFDALLGAIPVTWKVFDAQLLWLIGCVRFAACNSFSSWNALKFTPYREKEDAELKAFIGRVVEELGGQQ